MDAMQSGDSAEIERPSEPNTSPKKLGRFGIPRRTWMLLMSVALLSATAAAVTGGYLASQDGSVNVTDALVVTEEDDTTPGQVPVPTDPEALGAPFPDFDLETLAGSRLRLSELRGTPILINFWASTCPPCLKEMPALESIATRGNGKIEVIGVDSGESAADGQDMVKRTGVTYSSVTDPQQELSAEVGVIALPSTVLVNAEGQIVYIHTGALTEAEIADLVAERLGVGL